jgi:CRP-like cAMP-binding protein
MREYLSVLKKCSLFADVEEQHIGPMLECLGATVARYKKDEYILRTGDTPEWIGVVLKGHVHILREDFWGNRTILTAVEPSDLFAEAFSCAETEALPISAVAHVDTTALLVDYGRVIATCSTACTFHQQLIKNMVRILAFKNIMLMQKMQHITRKTTREKVISYLSEQALLAGRDRFDIPFNRQELADYLSVERSALSATLSNMKRDGLIDYHKNSFRILKGFAAEA